MLAAVFGALALTGASGPLWWSDVPPRAGQPYVAVSYTGQDGFWCAGSVGRKPVQATIYTVEGTAVCVLHVPAGTAGQKLAISYEMTTQQAQSTTFALGFVRPKVIRR